jgi:hypothetical protein
VTGIKIARNQTISATGLNLNLALGATDATGSQPFTLPALSGWNAVSQQALYVTAHGAFPLERAAAGAPPASYPTVPTTESTSGDYYLVGVSASGASPGVPFSTSIQTSATPLQSLSVALPALPTAVNSVTASATPSFPATYNGFTVAGLLTYEASQSWTVGSSQAAVQTFATSGYLNGAPLVAPLLANVPGILNPPASGATIHFALNADINVPLYTSAAPLGTSEQTVFYGSGGYTQP